MRTTQKAAPLVAIGVAGLLGLGAQVRVGALALACCRGRRWPVGAGGADRAGRAAARARHGDREAAHLEAHPGRLDRRRPRPRPGPEAELARAGAAGPDLRQLHLGRHHRRDPAARDEAPGRDPLRDPLRRPARDRPALDGRPARHPGPAAARPAAAARAPDGRRRDRHRERRRPVRAAAPSTPRRPRPSSTARASSRPQPTGPTRAIAPARGELGRAARAARGAPLRRRRRARASCTSTARGRPRSWTAAPRGWRAWPPSARCRRSSPILYAADLSQAQLRRDAGTRGRGRGQRLQPPPPLRAGVRPPEPGRHAAREGAARPQPGDHRPVPRPRHGRPDGRGAEGRELRARAQRRRAARVPRARRDQGLRRRPGHGLVGRPLLPPAQPLDRDRLRQAARRGRTSSCCRCATRAAR